MLETFDTIIPFISYLHYTMISLISASFR